MKKSLVFLLFVCGICNAQTNHFLDSLKLELKKAHPDSTKIDLLNKIAYEYDSDSLKVSDYSFQAIELATKISYSKGVAFAYTNLGWMHMQIGHYSEAIAFYEKSLQESKRAGNAKGVARAFNGLGMLYEYQGKSSKALDNHLKAKDILEKIEHIEGLASSYNNIANIYQNQGNTSDARQYYFKVLAIDSSLLEDRPQYSKYGIAYSFHNIGNTYRNEKNFKKALEYYQKALKLKKELGNKRDLASTYNRMGVAYFYLKEYQKTIEFNEKSLALYRETGVKTRLASPLIELGNAYREVGQLETSLRYIKEGLNVAEEIGEAKIVSEGYKALADTYAAKQDFKLAHRYLQIFKSKEDSLKTDSLRKRIVQLESEYQFDKEKDSLKLINEARELGLQKDLRYQQNIQLATTIGLLLTLVLLIISISYYQSKRKTADLLMTKAYKLSLANAENFLQREEISEQNKELSELHEVKDRIFSIIAHDLKSPIVGLQSLLYLIKEETGLKEEEKQAYMTRLSKNVAGISDLLNNLLYWAKFQMQGSLQITPEPYLLSNYIKESVGHFSEIAFEKNIRTHIAIDPGIPKVLVDLEILRFLLRNLLNNAYKFSNNGGAIHIRVKRSEDSVQVSIKDEGVGISPERKEVLFKGFVESEPGTASEKGTGLGLKLSKEFVEQSGGQIGLESTPGMGSTFWFTLPTAQLEENLA